MILTDPLCWGILQPQGKGDGLAQFGYFGIG